MPRDLILHIGWPKTGSTSIQHLLATNRPVLLEQGIVYPATPSGNMHIVLAAAFASAASIVAEADSVIWQGRTPEAAIATHLAELEAELTALPGNVTRIILSSEQFNMYQRTRADVRRLRDFVMRFADRCTVVVYLRRQDEHFASLYSQTLRLGNTAAPDMANPPQDYDYEKSLALWSDVFGKNHVVPRIFERPAEGRFDVVSDFAHVCGFDLSQMKRGGEVNKNESMTPAGQETLRQAGRRLSGGMSDKVNVGPVWRRITVAVSSASPGKGWLPTQAQAKAFMDRFAASNEAVRAAYFPERTSLFRMNFEHLPEHERAIPAEEVQAATIDAFVAALKESVAREAGLMKEKATLAKRLGDAALERAAITQAVRLDGTNVALRLRLARLLASQNEHVGAQQQIDIAEAMAPASPAVAATKRQLSRPSENRSLKALNKPV